jgi:hypothetical protein
VFALAGMNVHINHDLPLSVVHACIELTTTPTTDPHRDDYQKIVDRRDHHLAAQLMSDARARVIAFGARHPARRSLSPGRNWMAPAGEDQLTDRGQARDRGRRERKILTERYRVNGCSSRSE